MAQHYDPNTGRPLPSPRWWDGTKNLRTEDQWFQFMLKQRTIAAGMCITAFVLGLVLLVLLGDSPGFGVGSAIILWAWALGVSPLYFAAQSDLKRWFGDKL